MRKLSQKQILALMACIVVIAAAFYVWALTLNGTICLSQTGVQPDPGLFNDPTFYSYSEGVRSDVLEALLRQYDPTTGLFTYSIHPDGTIASSDNAIRQLLGSRVLAMESTSGSQILALHKQNLETIMRDWYRTDGDKGYVYFDGKSKLGANALLLRLLVASPYFNDYQEEAASLARGIYSLQNADGSLKPWYIEPDYAYDAEYLLTFYSGEATLALFEYAERSGDTTAYSAAKRAEDYYLVHYVDEIDTNYYPAYVPWHTEALAYLYEKTADKKYADAVFTMNDKLLELQDRSQYVGRFGLSNMPQYGTPHAASDSVYTEGLAYAYDVATEVGDSEHMQKYHDAIVYAVFNLGNLRFRPEPLNFLYYKAAEERIKGGIQATACDSYVRIDSNAHTVDALTKVLKIWPK